MRKSETSLPKSLKPVALSLVASQLITVPY